MNKPKIYLDIDDVIVNWQKAYSDKYNTSEPKRWQYGKYFKDRLQLLRKEKQFWLNIELKNKPNFIPNGFVSARAIPKKWTYELLKKYNIPGRSNITQVNWGHSKVEILKEIGCEIFVDDNIKTFKECNSNGIFCLLMDASTNKHIKTDYRIYDLNIKTILNKWENLK